jgi:hypothetical protein
MSSPNEITSFVNTYKFPGGQIQVAVVPFNGMVVHAYRLRCADASDQWFAPIKAAGAEAATKLAYGRDKVGGRQKTAQDVWNEMLSYLEPIPQL